MKLMCWNARGIRAREKIRWVSKMVVNNNLGFVGIVKTKREEFISNYYEAYGVRMILVRIQLRLKEQVVELYVFGIQVL